MALQTVRTEQSVCRGELDEAQAALGGKEVDEVQLDLPDGGRLFEFLGAATANKVHIEANEERRRLLEKLDPP